MVEVQPRAAESWLAPGEGFLRPHTRVRGECAKRGLHACHWREKRPEEHEEEEGRRVGHVQSGAVRAWRLKSKWIVSSW